MQKLLIVTSCTLALAATSLRAHAETDTNRRAAESERSFPWVWTNAELGLETANLRTFTANTETLAVGIVPTAGVGPAFGVGAGLRIVFLTLGLRARGANLTGTAADGHTQSFQLWTIDGELGIRVPLRRFEPNFTFAFGYATFGGLGQAVHGLSDGLDVNGANARLGVGLDYFVTRHLTIGVNGTFEALMLARKGVSLRDLAEAKRVGSVDEAQARVLEANGSSIGTALVLTGGAGLHF